MTIQNKGVNKTQNHIYSYIYVTRFVTQAVTRIVTLLQQSLLGLAVTVSGLLLHGWLLGK